MFYLFDRVEVLEQSKQANGAEKGEEEENSPLRVAELEYKQKNALLS